MPKLDVGPLVSDIDQSLPGDPEDIQLTGLSGGVFYILQEPTWTSIDACSCALKTGAHSVHQILHHASQLPNGRQAPFQSAIMQSNAIL